MIEDILSTPEIFTVNEKEYKAEFDCKSYGLLEAFTQKSIYKIQDLLAENNLFLTDTIDLICASVVKNHTDEEVKELRTYLQSNLSVITFVKLVVVQAFFKGIAPPEIFNEVKKMQNKIDDVKKKTKKKKEV